MLGFPRQRGDLLLARFCSVMSRAIFDAPTILPSAFLTGETVNETAIRLPCLRCRTVSKWSIRSPRLMRVRIARSSSCRSCGMTIVMGWPIASSAV